MEITRKEVIRAQWDQRKALWKIVKKTYNGCGGWRRFGGNFYISKAEAERIIKNVVNDYPQLYMEG